jgi:glycosyltransferase involved in cell wall biosynthesis
MRILAITNMYPTPEHPTLGVFVEQQVKGLRQIGLDIEVYLIERASKGMSAYVGVKQRIRNRISAAGPDIVHVMYGGVIAYATTRVAGSAPVVISFCGSDLLGSASSALVPRLTAAYGVWASHRAALGADGIIVKSTNLSDALPADVNRSKVRVIPNGIDLERFRPAEQGECRRHLGWRPDRFHVLFSSGAGNPCKRPELAVAAVNALRELGVPAELHFLTGVLPDAVPLWLNASDALILTSLTEGSPNVVKEALACNLPVVSVPVGDVSEQLQGISGCHLSAPDPSDLAEKLNHVYSSRSRTASRERIQELSLNYVAERLSAFYREVLASWKEMRNPSIGKTTARQSGGAGASAALR